jgi:hypothetical protein
MRLCIAILLVSSVGLGQPTPVPAAFTTRRNDSSLAGPVAVVSGDAGVRVITADISGPVRVSLADGGFVDNFDYALVAGLGAARGVAGVESLVLASAQGSMVALQLIDGRLVELGTPFLGVGGAVSVEPNGDFVYTTNSGSVGFARVSASVDGGVEFTTDGAVPIPTGVAGLAKNPIDQSVFVSNGRGLSRIADDGTVELVAPVLGSDLGSSPPAGLATMVLRDGGVLLFVAHTSDNDILVFAAVDGGLDLVTSFGVSSGAQRLSDPLFVAVSAEAAPGFPAGVLAVHDRQPSGSTYRVVSLQEAATVLGVPALAHGVARNGDAGPGPTDGGRNDGGVADGGRIDGGTLDGGAPVDGGTGGASGRGGTSGAAGRGGSSARGGSTGQGGSAGPPEPPAGCGCGPGGGFGIVLAVTLVRRRRLS